MKKYIAAGLFLILSLSVFSQQTVRVDLQETKINWLGKKPTGEHTGYVSLSSGELIVKDNEVMGGNFTMDMRSITDTDLQDENMRKKLETHLKSADFFDVEKSPVSKFVITRVTRLKSSSNEPVKTTHRVEGDLTIKGITKKISFDASINSLNNRFIIGTPQFVINRTDWGVNYQSKSVLAGLKDQFIYDDITLSIELFTK